VECVSATLGEMIFKYSPPSAHTLENLLRKVIFCRHYGDFNDPFEFWCEVLKGAPDLHRERDRYVEALRAMGLGPDEHDLITEEYFPSLDDPGVAFDAFYDSIRIACFGSEDTNLLMWSHYADGLRGFCVAFDEDELSKSSPEPEFMEVQYEESPPVVDSFVYAVAYEQYEYLSDPDNDEKDETAELKEQYDDVVDEAMQLMMSMRQRVFASKPFDWKYEKEKRLLIRAPGGGRDPLFLSYPASAVKHVIVGERMPAQYRAQLEQLIRANYGAVPILEAKRSDLTYAITIS
jgi:hypothetical protein